MKQIYLKNKKAFFDFEIIEKIEAGVVLTGTEVKSIRDGKISFNGSFCVVLKDGIYLRGADITLYREGTYNNHEPKRDRKLLLHKKQIKDIHVKIDEKGLTVVPLAIYNNEHNIFKIEIAIVRGRKNNDKREYIKERDANKQMKNVMLK